nr:hypothetical protein K-LCC10_0062 [Kaumoebavirus]
MESVMNVLKNHSIPTAENAYCVSIDSLVPKVWDNSLPTFTSRADRTEWILNSKLIRKRFFNSNEYLRGIDLKNVLIAGGAICGTIIDRSYDDIDLFIYGLNDSERQDKLEYLVQAISAALYAKSAQFRAKFTKSNEAIYKTIYAIRNQNCVTIQDDYHRKVQIILRNYKSVDEILNGFDLGSSAVGLRDDGQVVVSGTGKFAYEYGANIVDTNRRSTTYELRLAKYYDRDFDIIAPYFTENVKVGESITIYGKLGIYISKVERLKYSAVIDYAGPSSSDYQFDLSPRGVKYYNLNLLLKGETDPAKYYYIASGVDCADVLGAISFTRVEDIIEHYHNYTKKMYNDGKFNGGISEKIFGMAPLLMFAKLINNPDSIKTIVSNKVKEMVEKMNNIKPVPLTWREGGSQVSGSFNPIIADPKDWYGEYYKNPAN